MKHLSLAEAVAARFRQPLIRRAVDESALNRLRKDGWYEPLSRLQGTIDQADGLERIASKDVFDYSGVPSKQRSSGYYRRIAPLMKVFGWTAIKAISNSGDKSDIARGYERSPAQGEAPPVETDTPLVEALPIPVDGSDAVVAIRGVITKLDDAGSLIEDIARNIQNSLSDSDLAAKHGITEAGWRQMAGIAALRERVRATCEMRVRSGLAPQEESRVYWASAGPKTLLEVFEDKTISPIARLQAGKQLEKAAGLNQGGPANANNGVPVVTLNINLGNGIGLTGVAYVPRDVAQPPLDVTPLPPDDDDAAKRALVQRGLVDP